MILHYSFWFGLLLIFSRNLPVLRRTLSRDFLGTRIIYLSCCLWRQMAIAPAFLAHCSKETGSGRKSVFVMPVYSYFSSMHAWDIFLTRIATNVLVQSMDALISVSTPSGLMLFSMYFGIMQRPARSVVSNMYDRHSQRIFSWDLKPRVITIFFCRCFECDRWSWDCQL